MATNPQPLSIIADVTIVVDSPAVNGPPFNQGLFIGTSSAIPSYGVNPRVRKYLAATYVTAMLADGYTLTSPEFICMQIYFSQSPQPQAGWAGRQDLTAIQSAVPSGRTVIDGAMSSVTDPTFLDSVTADFQDGDVGAQVIVVGAGVAGVDLVTTIASVTSTTEAILTVGASTTVAGAVAEIGAYGKNYKVGDQVGVTQGGASFGVLTVATIGPDGQVLTLNTAFGKQGTGYAIASGVATTGGSGTGLDINITAIGETPLQAAIACRAASPSWYAFMCTSETTSDVEAISAWVLSQIGTYYLATTQDVASLNGTTPSLLSVLFGASSKRTWVQWASTQSGLYPNQIYFTAAVMGCAMAANTQLAGSAYSMKFSAGVPLAGVYVEPLTAAQIANIEGPDTDTGPNGNLFINYANSFNVLEQGTSCASGQFFDEILNLDILASNIQYNILNVLSTLPKVPQTEPGQAQLEQAVKAALALSASTGFVAPGIWQGRTVLGLTPGTPLPQGYLVQSPKYSTQSSADRQLRKAMPIYVCLIEAGAVHFVVISVLVQR